MRALVLICLMALSAPAGAQDVFDRLDGTFGSARDPAGSCDVNPHRLELMTSPPHLFVVWPAPWINADGQTEFDRRYDILDHDTSTLTLRREDEVVATDSGNRPIWILRMTSQPDGYCWGRTDWPALRCEDQQLRCGAPVS
jgi:hypothetical protein